MKSIALILLWFSVSFSFSQKEVILDEQFNNNSNKWQEGKTSVSTVSINAGRGMYIIQYKAPVDAWTAWKDLEINVKRDFEIEALIYKDKGVKNYGYGILWGGTDNNYYSFLIAANGYYCVGKVVDGIWADITPNGWIETSAVHQGNNKFNKLTVRKIGDTYEFDINSNKVAQIKCGPFFGNKIGFNVNNKQQILVDWVKVRYLN